MITKKKFTLAITIILSVILSLTMFTGCGGSSSGGDDPEKSAPADPKEKFVGSWMIAGAETEGVMLGGDFASMLELEDTGVLEIKEDGTGTLKFGTEENETGTFTWALGENDNTINITPDIKSESSDEDSDLEDQFRSLRYEDEALFLDMEQDDRQMSMIFTHDGKYDKIKEFNMDDSQPITSEDALIGKWQMTGMMIMGIYAYGDPEALSELSGGTDMSVTFNDDGTATMDTSEGTWDVTDDGATLTTAGISGDITCPITKLGDDILIDMSEMLSGTEFIMILSPAK